MTTVLTAALFVLVGLFSVAALAKLRSPASTLRATKELGAPRWVAPLVAPAELVTVLALLLAPAVGAIFGAALLGAFTMLLVRIVRSGRTVRCGCFGAANDSPVTSTSVVRNVGMLGLCAAAGFAPSLRSIALIDAVPAVFVGAGIVLSALMAGALIDVARATGSVFPSVRVEVES